MKKLFSLLSMLYVSMGVFAQSSMLATLSHNGDITTYYGATAYRDAVNVATHGDIITLSSGSFTAVNITKALTIRGAGMAIDTVAKSYPTILSGDFNIQIPDTVTKRLTLEGIYHNQQITVSGTLKNATFLKDRLSSIVYTSGSYMKNLTFIHCRIASVFSLSDEGSASCVNCFISNPSSFSATSSNFEFTNSVIRFTTPNNWPCNVKSSIFQNCIIYHTHSDANYSTSNYILPTSCTAFYCVGMSGSGYNLFDYQSNKTNYSLGKNTYSNIFKSSDGSYYDDETFELTDEAKTKYIGADGKQVGMYGGDLPFTATPTNPQITKCNVAAKSSADGKLSVDIEVSAAE